MARPEVIVRPVGAADGDDLIAANRASIELHRPWAEPFTDRAGFEAYLAGLDGERTLGLVARNSESGAVVGLFTLSQIFRKGFQNAYLGFHGAAGQTGRGLMTKALRSVLACAFDDVGLHRVEANVQPGNLRSIALLRRVGFRKEGFSPKYLRIDGDWRDHERWAILSDELERD